MSSTVVVGGMEISSNNESAADMVAALKPKEDGKEPRILRDGGKDKDEPANPLSKAAQEMGKKGGEAAAKAREQRDKDVDTKDAKTEPKSKETKGEPVDKDADKDGDKKEGKPRHDPEARVRQATSQAAEAKRALEEERKARQALEERLSRLERGEKPAEPKPAAQAQPAAAGDDPEPKEDDFDTYADWIKAHNRWSARDALREAKQKDEREAQKTRGRAEVDAIKRRAADRILAAKEADPDWESKIDARLYEFIPTMELPEGASQGPDNCLADEIVLSEKAPELLVYLSAHEDEVKAILESPNPREIARKVALIEAKLTGEQQAQPAVPERRPTSQAPPPIKPVSASAPPSSADITGDLDFDEFMRRNRGRK